ncbi:copper-binding protein [Paraburkholderia sp. BCC1884]|uniref:copper-binding protein n=1 Tax=Paraburkholderia sp. BCC1884 TaxID=2562668 RepID=UPI00118226F0|nr:copper-binding protein [Paraburkholderia sp. BCC1884]
MKAATIGAALVIAAFAAAQPVWAQDTLASAAQGVVGAVQPVHVKAEIVGIDPGSRTLTLKGPGGNAVVVLVSQQVAGFDQLKVGDRVDVLYKNALLVKADRVTGKDKGIRKRVDTQVYAPASGGFESARQIEVLATVQKIDRKHRLVTLRGAYQTQTLEVGPDVDLKDVKVGDTIHAVFVSAAAVQVTPQAAAQ